MLATGRRRILAAAAVVVAAGRPDVRRVLIALCVPIDLAARATGLLQTIKNDATSSCQAQHPLSALGGHHRVHRHQRILRACRYGSIRRALGLRLRLANGSA